MAYKQVSNNEDRWRNLPDRDMNSQPFYSIQKGRGAAVGQYLPPMQGIIEKATVRLRKQIKKKTPKKKAQSRVSKRGVKSSPKRKIKKVTQVKRKATKPKGKKKGKNTKTRK